MRRIQANKPVAEFEIELMDGNVYYFRLDMRALALLYDIFGDGIETLAKDMSTSDLVVMYGACAKLLYAGIKTRHPEMEYDHLSELLPIDLEWINAMMETLGSAIPDIPASNPTTPPMLT